MKSILIFLLTFSLLQTSFIPWNSALADEPVEDETIFGDAPEGDQAAMEMLEQVIPLCKDSRGLWKQEIIKIPTTDDDFNCASLMKMEFDLLNEEGTPESEKTALHCVSRGLDAQGKLEFARSLEDLEALELPLDEHFNCPGKDQKISTCVGDIVCNISNMVADQFTLGLASKVAQGLGSKSGVCPASSTQTNCFNELIWGVVKNITTNIEGIMSLGKLAVDGIKSGYNAVKNWMFGVEESSREQHMQLQQEADKGLMDWVKDAGKKIVEKVTGFFNAMGTFIDRGIKDNFGCAEWTENRYSPVYGGEPRCKNPVVSWKCATCSQRLNMACGIAGFAGGEIVTAYLTGGALALGKAAVKAGAGTKIARIAGGTRAFKALSTAGKYAAKPFIVGGKAAIGVLKFSGKVGMGIMRVGRKWMLKIGSRTLGITKAGKMRMLKRLLKTEKVVKGAVTFLPKKYFQAMERAFVAGYHSGDGIRYLLKAKAVARESSLAHKSNEVLDFATESSQFNNLKGQFVKNQDEYNKILKEYQTATSRLRELGPDETARITRAHIQRLNQLEADNLGIMTRLVDEKKALQSAVATTSNATDVTLTATKVDDVKVVTRVDDVPQKQINTRTADDVLDSGQILAKSDDAFKGTFRSGDQIDLRYRTGSKDGTVTVLDETASSIKVRGPNDPATGRWVQKRNLDLDATKSFNNGALLGDDIVIPYQASSPTLARINGQGAKGDIVQLTYNNSRNGINGKITGEIIKETSDTIWIKNASFPDGTRIRKVNLNLAQTRNFNDTRHLIATKNLKAGDTVSLTHRGQEVSGEIVNIHQKSIVVRRPDGSTAPLRMRDIEKSSITSSAIDSSVGIRLTQTRRAATQPRPIRTPAPKPVVTPAPVVATPVTVTPLVNTGVSTTVVRNSRFNRIRETLKGYLEKTQSLTFNLKGSLTEIGHILSVTDDHVIIMVGGVRKVLNYSDILKITGPARLLLYESDDLDLDTDLPTNTTVTQDDPLVIPGSDNEPDPAIEPEPVVEPEPVADEPEPVVTDVDPDTPAPAPSPDDEDEDSVDIYDTDEGDEGEQDTAPMYGPLMHDYGPGTPLVPPQPMMLPPPLTYFHMGFN